MVTIGIDPHKDEHCAVAVDAVAREVSCERQPARGEGFAGLLVWARELDGEREWVIEDCRGVSGALERFLLDHGESVRRLAPHLMADARRSVATRGKADPIDALAVARAALRIGIEKLPVAKLAGPELEVRLLEGHRQRLVHQRTQLTNELRWQCHDLWPDYRIAPRALSGRVWQTKLAARLARADPHNVRVQIARDLLRRVRDLTRTITALADQLAGLVKTLAPQLLAQTGIGPLIAAKLIGEIAGIHRFATDAKLARMAGCAPIPASSGHTNRHRLDRGGNRQLNHAIHMLALSRIHHDPRTAQYLARQRARGKTGLAPLLWTRGVSRCSGCLVV